MIVLEKCYHIQCQMLPQTDRQIGLELLAVLDNDKMDKFGRLEAIFLVVCDPSMNKL